MSDTKKFRLSAVFKMIRNNVTVVSESPDTGLTDYTDGAWNELQLVTGGGWVQLPFNIDMTGFNHFYIKSDQEISVSTNVAGGGHFAGTVFMVSGAGAATNTTAPYINNQSGTTANIRYALVN